MIVEVNSVIWAPHLSWTKFVQQTITKPVICHHHQHKADILLRIVKFISIKICQNVPPPVKVCQAIVFKVNCVCNWK